MNLTNLLTITLVLAATVSVEAKQLRIEAGLYDCGVGICNPVIGQSSDLDRIYMRISENIPNGYCPYEGNYLYRASKTENLYRDGKHTIRVLSKTSLTSGNVVCIKAK